MIDFIGLFEPKHFSGGGGSARFERSEMETGWGDLPPRALWSGVWTETYPAADFIRVDPPPAGDRQPTSNSRSISARADKILGGGAPR